jgi:hypothetical protein
MGEADLFRGCRARVAVVAAVSVVGTTALRASASELFFGCTSVSVDFRLTGETERSRRGRLFVIDGAAVASAGTTDSSLQLSLCGRCLLSSLSFPSGDSSGREGSSRTGAGRRASPPSAPPGEPRRCRDDALEALIRRDVAFLRGVNPVVVDDDAPLVPFVNPDA